LTIFVHFGRISHQSFSPFGLSTTDRFWIRWLDVSGLRCHILISRLRSFHIPLATNLCRRAQKGSVCGIERDATTPSAHTAHPISGPLVSRPTALHTSAIQRTALCSNKCRNTTNQFNSTSNHTARKGYKWYNHLLMPCSGRIGRHRYSQVRVQYLASRPLNSFVECGTGRRAVRLTPWPHSHRAFQFVGY
jgi:hypothetical protein